MLYGTFTFIKIIHIQRKKTCCETHVSPCEGHAFLRGFSRADRPLSDVLSSAGLVHPVRQMSVCRHETGCFNKAGL